MATEAGLPAPVQASIFEQRPCRRRIAALTHGAGDRGDPIRPVPLPETHHERRTNERAGFSSTRPSPAAREDIERHRQADPEPADLHRRRARPSPRQNRRHQQKRHRELNDQHPAGG